MEKGIAGLVLAAGSSQRMGVLNKLVLPNGEQSIIRTLLSNLIVSPVKAVFVVLGHQSELVQQEVEGLGVQSIFNPDYQNGLGTSISLGIKKISQLGYNACLLCLGDLPLLKVSHFSHMVNAYQASPNKQIFVPFYCGKQGHPLIFNRTWFHYLTSLSGDKGAKELINTNPDCIQKVDFEDRAGLADVDTYDRYLELTERSQVIKDDKQDSKTKKQPIKLEENQDYYMNDEGLMVFTAKYHLKRGYCCESGCLHCPYGFKLS
ncbi:MAG: NTP transferase domain-containing protein [Oligoflexales bacterium]